MGIVAPIQKDLEFPPRLYTEETTYYSCSLLLSLFPNARTHIKHTPQEKEAHRGIQISKKKYN